MRNGFLTIQDLADRGLDRLEIACCICDRRGSYEIGKALERWGGEPLPDLLLELSRDCQRGKSAAIYDRCGAYYPALVSDAKTDAQ